MNEIDSTSVSTTIKVYANLDVEDEPGTFGRIWLTKPHMDDYEDEGPRLENDYVTSVFRLDMYYNDSVTNVGEDFIESDAGLIYIIEKFINEVSGFEKVYSQSVSIVGVYEINNPRANGIYELSIDPVLDGEGNEITSWEDYLDFYGELEIDGSDWEYVDPSLDTYVLIKFTDKFGNEVLSLFEIYYAIWD
jgi:hypothetical protein